MIPRRHVSKLRLAVNLALSARSRFYFLDRRILCNPSKWHLNYEQGCLSFNTLVLRAIKSTREGKDSTDIWQMFL